MMSTIKTAAKTVLGMNLASLVHLGRRKPGEFIQGCLCALSAARFPWPTANLPIPVLNVKDLFGCRQAEVRFIMREEVEGALPFDQAVILAALVAVEKPASILEIGTFMGSTTRLLAENCPQATIHTVDLPLEYSAAKASTGSLPKDDFQLIAQRRVGRDFRDHPCAQRIIQHLCDTAEWDFSAAGSPSFFFIDGSHTYEYCKNDSDKCFEICSGKGVFVWHDCDRTHPGVIRCLMEWRAKGRDVRRIAGTPLAYWKGG